MHMYASVYVCAHACMCVVCAFVRACVYARVCVFVYVHMHASVCVCVRTHEHTAQCMSACM